MLNVYILCGGLGTRLGKKYSKIPKCLINIEGKPFLHWQLEYLEKQKIKKVVLCVGHLSNMIKQKIKEKNFNLDIKISEDGKYLLGTGGALKKAVNKHKDETFFVMYGDSYIRVNLEKFFKKYKELNEIAIMAVIKNKNKWDKSNVLFNTRNLIKYNKTNTNKNFEYIDYGISILKSSVLNNYPEKKFFDLAEVLNDISYSNNLGGHKVNKRFYQIGNEAGLKETYNYLKRFRK